MVSQAVSLGIPFSNDPNGPVVDWDAPLTSVSKCWAKVVRLRLSAFGRATVGATYSTSKLLHLLEHVGPLPSSLTSGWLGACTTR